MVSIRSLGVLLITLMVFFHGAFAEEPEMMDEEEETRLSFPGMVDDPAFKSLRSATPPTASWLKAERDRQLKQRGMRVTVWMENVDVGIEQTNGTVKQIENAASCPIRVITNDLLCTSADYGDISDVAISCRRYGPWDCSDVPQESQKVCRSKRKMIFKSAGDASDMNFRVLAHAGSDPFPTSQFFSVAAADLPAPLNICRIQRDQLDGQREVDRLVCQIKYDQATQDKEGYSNVMKYTVFKQEVLVTDPNPLPNEPTSVRFQCPPVDPYFIIRR